MPTEDPLPNMTAQERADFAQAKVTNRAAAERAAHSPAGRGSVLDVIEQQRSTREQPARDNGRER